MFGMPPLFVFCYDAAMNPSRTLIVFLLFALPSLAEEPAQPPSAFGFDAPQTAAPPPPQAEEADPNAAPGESEKPFHTLSLRARVSQLMLATMEGQKQPNVQDMGYLQRYTPAGAIIDHSVHPDLAQAYVAKLKGVEKISGVPFWVGTDIYKLTRAERTLASAFVQIPSPLAAAAARDEPTQRKLGRLIADHLTAMGFNLHLGPALSLAPSMPGAAPSIAYFGSDPAFASDCGTRVLSELIAGGIDAVPMGFPGGAFNREPHAPSALVTPEPLLMESDLLPFVRAIETGVPIMHVGTTLVPTIDTAARPACLSDAVMKTLLRDKLGFQGVVMAGPLDAPELASQYDPAESALLALRNGADLLYFETQPSLVMRVVDKLVSAVEQGLLPEATINAALERILAAKLGVDAAKRPVPDSDKSRQLEKRKDLLEEVRDIERRSITIIQNNGNLLPLERVDGPIGVTGVFSVEAFKDQMEEYLKPISQQPIKTAQYGGRIPDFEIDRLTRHIRGIRTVVAVLTDDIEPQGGRELIQGLKAKGAAVVLVLLGHPGNARFYREADAIVLGYCEAVTHAITLESVAEVIMGEPPVTVMGDGPDFHVKRGEERTYDLLEVCRAPAGMLPVAIDELYRVGRAVSYSPGDAVKSAEWLFGDGSRIKKSTAVHAFETAGRYPVTLTVTDQHKNESSGTFYMVVEE